MADRGGTVGQYSLSTRASEWYSSVTLATRSIIFLCSALYLYGLIFGYNLSLVCLQPYVIANDWHYAYTFLTAGFFHFSFLHILFNMMSYYPMGSALERTTGTLPFCYLMILFEVLGAFIHFVLAYISFVTNAYPAFYYSCSVGFSGVIFTIITIECHNDDGNRNFFGFSFPSRLYPWILLILLQLFFGNVSFLGHLSGILVGYLYVHKRIDPLVPVKKLNNLEGALWMGRVVSMNGYITDPNSFSSLPTTVPTNEGSSNSWGMPSMNWFSSSQASFPGAGRVLGSNLHVTSPPAPPSPTTEKTAPPT